MTTSEAFVLLRANPHYETISDTVLHGLLACVEDNGDAVFSDVQLNGIKRHLKEYLQYYAA
ncbi:hypothetical protein K0504_02930 [Neiella marina]|uniref:Uncharacterized protein n=1 Tax=Neiella holothuriorum TaxID=2870530 RepID=A0ABS7ECF5_9GAMM|nr:hypothetical protein [Neiella holothuriorum]MBW8189976.1 hypothetical protein [Neiella holothuriorum]